MYYVLYNTTFLSSLTVLMNLTGDLVQVMENYNLTWPKDFQFQNGRLYHFKKTAEVNSDAHSYCRGKTAQLWNLHEWDNLEWVFSNAIPDLENNSNNTIWIDHLLKTIEGISIILNPDKTPFVAENRHRQRIDPVEKHNRTNCFSIRQESNMQFHYHSANCSEEFYVVCARKPWKVYARNYTMDIPKAIERTKETLSSYISKMEVLKTDILSFQVKLPSKTENNKIKDIESPRKVYSSVEQHILHPYKQVINRLITSLESNIEENTINALMSAYQQYWDDFEDHIRDRLGNPQNIHKNPGKENPEFYKVYNNDPNSEELDLLIFFSKQKSDLNPDVLFYQRQRFYEITFVDFTLAIGSGLAFLVGVAKIIHDCRKKEENHRTVLVDDEGSQLNIYKADTRVGRAQHSKASPKGVKYSAIVAQTDKYCLESQPTISEITPIELEEKDRPYSERDKYSVSSFGSNSDCFEVPIVPHSAIILQAPPVGIISIRRSESNKSVRFDPETIY